MGNVMDSETKESDKESAREIITDLQRQISFVDHSLTGLAKSIDSMQAACKMLLLSRKEKEDNVNDVSMAKKMEEGQVSDSDLALNLLRCIEESVTDHKLIAVECVRKLLHFMDTTVQKSEFSTKENGVELSLDTYFSAKNPFDCTHMYYDEKVKALCFEVDDLKKLKTSQRNRIDILNAKEYDLMEENDILRQQLNVLDNKLHAFMEEKQTETVSKTENHTEENDRNVVRKNNNELSVGKQTTTTSFVLKPNLTSDKSDLVGKKTEAESSKDEKIINENNKSAKREKTVQDSHSSLPDEHEMIKVKRILKVQVFRKYTKAYIDRCLIDLVQQRARVQNVDLNIVRCSNRQDLNKDIPVLVMCTYEVGSSEAILTVVTDAMDRIEATLKVAAVILHTGAKKTDTNKSFSHLKDYQPYSSLGGIFDIACDFHKSVLNCLENNDKVDSIINFICKRSS